MTLIKFNIAARTDLPRNDEWSIFGSKILYLCVCVCVCVVHFPSADSAVSFVSLYCHVWSIGPRLILSGPYWNIVISLQLPDSCIMHSVYIHKYIQNLMLALGEPYTVVLVVYCKLTAEWKHQHQQRFWWLLLMSDAVVNVYSSKQQSQIPLFRRESQSYKFYMFIITSTYIWASNSL